MGSAPKPNLVKSTALSKAQAVFARINSLLPSYSTPISPVTVYDPLPVNSTLGNELLAAPSGGTTNALWGVWTAPNLNNGANYSVQVECFAAGAGGGGGTPVIGGGGGAGGEYAAEPVYTVQPGLPYIWLRGIGGPGGTAQPASGGNQTVQGGCGFNGGDTIFDLAGTALAGGVHAHGGQPGDISSAGSGGTGGGGTGAAVSTNTLHSAGGNGGTTQSGVASDNPSVFQNSATYFSERPSIPPTWLRMDDTNISASGLLNNDSQASPGPASVQNFTGGLQSVSNPAAPLQAPTVTGNGGYNNTQLGSCVQFKLGKLSSASARITAATSTYSGSYLMVSGWIQCDPSGVWGNTGSGNNATIATNCQYTGTNKAGAALYFQYNSGTWTLNWYCGNGSAGHQISTTSVTPTPGTWYYVVAVFNAGTMTLYVDGASVSSGAAGFSTVPGGAYQMTLGLRADQASGQYFGYMSNFWFAESVPTATLLSTAWGATPATGGAGGGSSGGPYLASANTLLPTTQYTGGNAGSTGTTPTGGAGGAVPTQSAYTAGYTTDGHAGGAGSNASSGNAGTAAIGAGGGGSGTSVTPKTVTALTYNLTSAVTFNGIDGTQPAIPYNPNTQGTQATLVAGGQASDPVTGSKNSILVLPPGIKAALSGATIVDCYLTVYNANPSNTITPILEISYSADSSMPSNYESSAAYSSITQVAPYLLLNNTNAQQISLMNTGFTAALQSGAATALVLGPGGTAAASPSFDAYNAPAGNYFYTSIYGPGSLNSAGSSTQPVLTLLYTTGTPQQGETGGGGSVAVTVINNEGSPIAAVQPFATVDSQGNAFAQGLTGPTTAFQPGGSPGSYVPETWHSQFTFSTGWGSASGYPVGYRLLPTGDIQLCGRILASSGVGNNMFTLPAAYIALLSNLGSINSLSVPVCALSYTFISGVTPGLLLNSAGIVSATGFTPGSGNRISLDGIIFPVSSLVSTYPIL